MHRRGSDVSTRRWGFSLIELMLVLAVLAILLTVALPTYQDQMIAGRRAVARAALLTTAARQEQYLISHRQYASSLAALGFSGSPYALGPGGEVVPVDSPGRVYLVSISDLEPQEAPVSYTLQAIPQLGQAADYRFRSASG